MTKTPVKNTRTKSVTKNTQNSTASRRELLQKAVATGLLTGAGLGAASAQDRPRAATVVRPSAITKTRSIKIASRVADDALISRIDKILSKDLSIHEDTIKQTVDIIQEILPDVGNDVRTGILTIDIGAVGSIDPTDCTGNACSSHGCPVHGCTGEACDTQGCGTQTCNGHGCSPSHGCSKTSFGDAADLTAHAQNMLSSAWYDLGQLQNEIMDMKGFVLEIRSPQAMQIQTRFIR